MLYNLEGQLSALWWPRRVGWGGSWREVQVSCFTSLCSRNYHNIVKQLYCNGKYIIYCMCPQLEKEMATHSDILAWRIPGTEETGGLLSMGSHRVRHDWSDLAFMHALEKEMATHSGILAWRIPGTEEPGGLLSMGLHRVRHDWSDLAAAAAAVPPIENKLHEGGDFCFFVVVVHNSISKS